MLILKDEKYVKDNEKITDAEVAFKSVLNSGETFESDLYKSIMRTIDSVTEKTDTVIKTRFGLCTLNQLSTGCKTLLLLIYHINNNKYICIDECGTNVIELIVELSKKLDMKAYTTKMIPFKGKNINIQYNNKIFSDGFSLYKEMQR